MRCRRQRPPTPPGLTRAAAVLLVAAASHAGFSHVARAQDPLAEIIGLGRAEGSLPPWETPDQKTSLALSEKSWTIDSGVFVVGHPKIGYGTAFVISKEHRLLATCTRVADILHDAGELLAIAKENGAAYKADRVWYHPAIVRDRGGNAHARESNPVINATFRTRPDVAVVHLAGDTALPAAPPLADRDEAFDLFGKPAALSGFPGSDGQRWPQRNVKAAYKYRQGVIVRVADIANDAGAEAVDRQFFRHSIPVADGFSGAPIFTLSGRIVGMNISDQGFNSTGFPFTSCFGVRIDCLWELLAHHRLVAQIPIPVAAGELRLDRFQHDDPRIEELRTVQDLVQRAAIFGAEDKYADADRVLADAVKRMPNSASAYRARS